VDAPEGAQARCPGSQKGIESAWGGFALNHLHRPEPKENPMLQFFNNLWDDDAGQGLVEYVLLIALVAIGLIAIMIIFRNSIGGIFSIISSELDSAPAEGYPA
jgi:Flp pilus assembly pilin Flp